MKYRATTFVRTLYVGGKTYRADKDGIINADTPEVEKMCKAYKFKPIEEEKPKKEGPIRVKEVESPKEEPIEVVEEDVIVEVPVKK